MTDSTQPRLAVIFGDQLDDRLPGWLGLDPARDRLVMVEVADESRRVPSSRVRTAVFLSAMRHHAAELRSAGWDVDYVHLTDAGNTHAFGPEIERAIARHAPSEVVCVRPGSHDARGALVGACEAAGVPARIEEDRHFLSTPAEFSAWAEGRKSLTMEYFYREMRRAHGVLMDGKQPVGGVWNFDKENRKAFKQAPSPPPVPEFEADEVTRAVLDDMERVLPDLPGRLERWLWPVTRADARACLEDFVEHRLAWFGDHQDAMWTGEHTLFHSVISTPLNLKLLDPRDVISAGVAAYENGRAPINAVEGFVRQVLGWREFIRGVYFHEGPGYESRNGLDEHGSLPEFYWTGETDMRCVRHAVKGVLDTGYGHHIERLMVTGNFALIAGVEPGAVNDWYLGMFADGVEWVTSPNTVGMAMHADGGVVGTKPYAASGKYIQRMSNFCKSCAYDVKRRSGDGACPFNVFYWDFLLRHRERFASNTRMTMMLKNVDRLDDAERTQITVSAKRLRDSMGI